MDRQSKVTFRGLKMWCGVEEKSDCLLCGSKGLPLYSGLKDELFGVPGEWSIFGCSNNDCRLAWLNPRPNTEAMPLIYSDYYTHALPPDIAAHNRGYVDRIMRWLSVLVAWLTPLGRMKSTAELMHLDCREPGKILDVGCGSGLRLQKFQKTGWQVEGQEVDEVAASTARDRVKCPVHSGTLLDLKLAGESYDAIVMNHVLEHVDNPLEILAECKRLLKPGGRFVCVVPNFGGPSHRQFGRYWRGLEPPRHFFHFSPGNLRAAAASSGLTNAAVFTSIVNHEVFVVASHSIAITNDANTKKKVPLLRRISAVVQQYVLLARSCFEKVEGDEVVLMWDAPCK